MPQLDQFVFVDVYSSFSIYIVGLLYFSAYIVQTITYLAKLASNRVLYYGISIIALRSQRIAEMVMYALRYHCIQSIVTASSIITRRDDPIQYMPYDKSISTIKA